MEAAVVINNATTEEILDAIHTIIRKVDVSKHYITVCVNTALLFKGVVNFEWGKDVKHIEHLCILGKIGEMRIYIDPYLSRSPNTCKINVKEY